MQFFRNVLFLDLCIALCTADQVSHTRNSITGSLSCEVSDLASCARLCHRVGRADSKQVRKRLQWVAFLRQRSK